MSGHSKWSTIKHKKAVNDAVRSGVFTKMANAIAIAVKKGGGVGDPDMNFSLRLAVDKARAVSMPKENIQRAIERGMDKGAGAELAELVIEGFAPGGVSVVATIVTDSRNRSVSELRNLFEKHGGRMGEPGSVMYQFEACGIVPYDGALGEDMQLALIDLGMTDVVPDEEGGGTVYTIPERVHDVVLYLVGQGVAGVEGSLGYRPKVTASSGNPEITIAFLEALSDYDDVQEVYANMA